MTVNISPQVMSTLPRASVFLLHATAFPLPASRPRTKPRSRKTFLTTLTRTVSTATMITENPSLMFLSGWRTRLLTVTMMVIANKVSHIFHHLPGSLPLSTRKLKYPFFLVPTFHIRHCSLLDLHPAASAFHLFGFLISIIFISDEGSPNLFLALVFFAILLFLFSSGSRVSGLLRVIYLLPILSLLFSFFLLTLGKLRRWCLCQFASSTSFPIKLYSSSQLSFLIPPIIPRRFCLLPSEPTHTALWPLFHYLLWQDVATEYASADANYEYYEQVCFHSFLSS